MCRRQNLYKTPFLGSFTEHCLEIWPTCRHELSCRRYELKNSFSKRAGHVVCNFVNICRTLAYRYKQRALFSLLSIVVTQLCAVLGIILDTYFRYFTSILYLDTFSDMHLVSVSKIQIQMLIFSMLHQ